MPEAFGQSVQDGDELHNVVHWSEFDRGGHFAALEAPDLLAADLREFFRTLICDRQTLPA